jgi:hypothetical protein
MKRYLAKASHWRTRNERGDIPGWVMITVMTIVIASAILVIFQERVTTYLADTLDQYM